MRLYIDGTEAKRLADCKGLGFSQVVVKEGRLQIESAGYHSCRVSAKRMGEQKFSMDGEFYYLSFHDLKNGDIKIKCWKGDLFEVVEVKNFTLEV